MDTLDPSPLHSPHGQPEEPDAVSRPKPWIALAALLAAPLGSAIFVILALPLISMWDGNNRSIHWADAVLSAPLAFLFLAVGGPLVALFWKRVPFGPLTCAAFGAVCGTLAFYVIALGLSDVDDYAYFEREGLLFDYYLGAAKVVIMGTVAGLAGGLTFWGVCRLGLPRMP